MDDKGQPKSNAPAVGAKGPGQFLLPSYRSPKTTSLFGSSVAARAETLPGQMRRNGTDRLRPPSWRLTPPSVLRVLSHFRSAPDAAGRRARRRAAWTRHGNANNCFRLSIRLY